LKQSLLRTHRQPGYNGWHFSQRRGSRCVAINALVYPTQLMVCASAETRVEVPAISNQAGGESCSSDCFNYFRKPG